jgi:regulatory LuxR family protein
MSKLTELQKTWYKKLADVGFEDIEYVFKHNKTEEVKFLKGWTNPTKRTNSITAENKAEYFSVLEHYARTYVFKSERDRQIMLMIAEGKKRKDIAKELGCHRGTVMFVIRRYETIWNIRRWETEDLRSKGVKNAKLKKRTRRPKTVHRKTSQRSEQTRKENN